MTKQSSVSGAGESKAARVGSTAGHSDERAAGPSKWLQGLIPAAIVAASILVYKQYGHRPPSPENSASEALIPHVKTAEARPFQGTIEIAVEGVAKPYRHVSVAAEVAGRVRLKTPACEEATFVRKGDLLLEIDPTDYEIAVRRFTQELKQTEAALEELKVERENLTSLIELAQEDERLAMRDLERQRKLIDSGGAPQAAVDQSQRTQINARNALLTLQNQVRLLQARYDKAVTMRDLEKVELERAERDLARTRIVAPCDGTIVTESVEQDAYAAPGTILVVVNDTSAGEVACQLEMDDMYWLWGTRSLPAAPEAASPEAAGAEAAGQSADAYSFPRWPVKVEFPVQDMVCVWDGEMIRYGGTGMNLSTRTVPCQIHVEQPRGGSLQHLDGSEVQGLVPPPLTVGMFVTVRAQVKPHAPLLELPADALRAGPVVWVLQDRRLHIAPVKMARRMKDSVLVYASPALEGGLQAGQRIITSPLAATQEGMEVHDVQETAVPATNAKASREVSPLPSSPAPATAEDTTSRATGSRKAATEGRTS